MKLGPLEITVTWRGINRGLKHEIRRLVANDQRIPAIKLYRERTGATLKDAVDAVKRIAP